MDANGTFIGSVPVTTSGNGDANGAYSPDGSKVVFVRDFGSGVRAIFVANADGSNEQNLATSNCLCSSPSWSPDSQKIVYASDHHDPVTQNLDIYVMDAVDSNGDGEGDNRVRLTTSSTGVMADAPVFSPDGLKIVYSLNPNGVFDLYVMNSDGSSQNAFASYNENCFASDWIITS